MPPPKMAPTGTNGDPILTGTTEVQAPSPPAPAGIEDTSGALPNPSEAAPAPSAETTPRRGPKRIRATVAQVWKNGKRAWMVSWFVEGKRNRRFFGDRTAAEDFSATVEASSGELSEVWLSMTTAEREDLLRVALQAKRENVTFSRVFEDWKKWRDEARGDVKEKVTLEHAVEKLLGSKRTSGRDETYVENLKQALNRFMKGREKTLISLITADDVEAWLGSLPVGSRPTMRTRLSALFTFALRRNWITKHPCKSMETIIAPPRKITVLTPDQLSAAFDWILSKRPRMLGWFVLTTLCGLRPEEAQQTTWDAIVDDHIVVEAQTSKVRQRRTVYPLPSARAWLEFAKKMEAQLPVPSIAKRRLQRTLARHLGFENGWPHDVTRHSAASYWLAHTSNAAEVSEQLGHDARTLKKHYAALVTREQASHWWAIMPPKVVPFPKKKAKAKAKAA